MAIDEAMHEAGTDVLSTTTVHGSVNDEAYEGTVTVRFHTASGGESMCSFERLPSSFDPGTIGTHT